jgi:hypothetical protein
MPVRLEMLCRSLIAALKSPPERLAIVLRVSSSRLSCSFAEMSFRTEFIER